MGSETEEESPHDQNKSLEYWLTKATDPYLAPSSRPEFVTGFCEQVNEELEGPQVACRLLAHKIQSPYEVEALHGLLVLEACVQRCGQRFHNEIGKFRFLNEVIKILSPKYLGNQTNERVKQKAIELLYSWKTTMKHLTKLGQAYNMLKEQQIITQDPKYMDEMIQPPPPPPEPRVATFEDEEKSRLLAELLKSKNPDDLVAANRLIKSMVKAEDQKMEKVAKRGMDLRNADNNAQLLTEMIAQFDPSASTGQDVEIMKELSDSLIKQRPTLFKYAGDAAESDGMGLADVLTVNDDVSKAIDDYKEKVEPYAVPLLAKLAPTTTTSSPSSQSASNVDTLSSLLGFDLATTSYSGGGVDGDRVGNSSDLLPSSMSDLSLASDDVGMLGGGITPVLNRKPSSVPPANNALSDLSDVFGTPSASDSPPVKPPALNLPNRMGGTSATELSSPTMVAGTAALLQRPLAKGLMDLDDLSDTLIQKHLSGGKQPSFQEQRIAQQQRQKIPLRDLNRQTNQQGVASLSLSPLDPFPKSPLGGTHSSSNEPSTTSTLTTPPQTTTPIPEEIAKKLSYGPSPRVGGSEPTGPLPASGESKSPICNQTMKCSGVDELLSSVTDRPPSLPDSSSSGSGDHTPNSILNSATDKPATSSDVIENSSQLPSLEGILVPLETIKPGKRAPLVMADRHGVKVILHYTANETERGVLTCVLSISSTNTDPLSNIHFTANTTSQDTGLKLQTPTGAALPSYNPILPQSAITQIILIARTENMEKASLDYSLGYTKGDEKQSEHSISGSFDIHFNSSS